MTSHCIVSGAANWDLTLFRTDFIRLCCIAAPHSDFDTGQLIDTYNGITSNNKVFGKVNFHPSKIYPKRGPDDRSMDGPQPTWFMLGPKLRFVVQTTDKPSVFSQSPIPIPIVTPLRWQTFETFE